MKRSISDILFLYFNNKKAINNALKKKHIDIMFDYKKGSQLAVLESGTSAILLLETEFPDFEECLSHETKTEDNISSILV